MVFTTLALVRRKVYRSQVLPRESLAFGMLLRKTEHRCRVIPTPAPTAGEELLFNPHPLGKWPILRRVSQVRFLNVGLAILFFAVYPRMSPHTSDQGDGILPSRQIVTMVNKERVDTRHRPAEDVQPGESLMPTSLMYLVATTACMVLSTRASGQSAKDIRGPSPLVAIENEAPPKLIVDPPLPEPLALGRVFIQYRTENLRVVPVFGKGALDVSPRIGHVHISVDDAPWHFVDASSETIILVGLEPGGHKVLIELADPTHKVITSQTVKFTVPSRKSPKPDSH